MDDVQTYELTYITDILAIPSDRLEACLRDLQYGIEMLHLISGEGEPQIVSEWVWTDDDNHSVRMTANGKELIRLEVDNG